MARPQPKPVARRAGHPFDPEPPPEAPSPSGSIVSPAADGKQPPRAGKQLGLRIPEELATRLAACAEDTGIPQSTLLKRGLDMVLKTYQH